MPRKPNYDFERRERERARAAKKAAKAEAKRNRKAAEPTPAEQAETNAGRPNLANAGPEPKGD